MQSHTSYGDFEWTLWHRVKIQSKSKRAVIITRGCFYKGKGTSSDSEFKWSRGGELLEERALGDRYGLPWDSSIGGVLLDRRWGHRQLKWRRMWRVGWDVHAMLAEAAWLRHWALPLSLTRHESRCRWNFWKSSVLVDILIREQIPLIWEIRIPTVHSVFRNSK